MLNISKGRPSVHRCVRTRAIARYRPLFDQVLGSLAVGPGSDQHFPAFLNLVDDRIAVAPVYGQDSVLEAADAYIGGPADLPVETVGSVGPGGDDAAAAVGGAVGIRPRRPIAAADAGRIYRLGTGADGGSRRLIGRNLVGLHGLAAGLSHQSIRQYREDVDEAVDAMAQDLIAQ